MSTELALQHQALDAQPANNFLSMLERVVRDPNGINVEALDRMLAMKERVDARAAETAFQQSMQDAQAEMEPIWRDRVNDHTKSRYATLEAIDRAIRPIYTKHGFSLTAGSKTAPAGHVCVVMDCMHRQGYKRAYELTLPVDDVRVKGATRR